MRNWIALPMTCALAGCGGGNATLPTVISTIPADRTTNVARDTTIIATFSEPMRAASFTGSTFTLSPVVAGSVQVNGGAVKFMPVELLASGTTYTATITKAAENVSGDPIATSFSWSFTTLPQTQAAPAVSSTNPGDGATGIAIHTTVSATFSKAMSPASISTANFTIAPGVSGTVTYHGVTATFVPAAALALGTLYTATITTDARDAAGTPLVANYSWRFTTEKPASCTDSVKDGDETAVDCGGSCSPCAAGKQCLVAHDCTSAYCSGAVCSTCPSGNHACNNACVSNANLNSCGPSCTPCSAPANADPTCDGTSCGFTCKTGFHNCGGVCVSNASVNSCGPSSCTACTPPANAGPTCDGTSCGFSCNSGYHACGSNCAINTSIDSCGASCTACVPPANATANCNGTSCGFTCNLNYHLNTATNQCDPDTETCCGPGCVDCSANPLSYKVCQAGACIGACVPACVGSLHCCLNQSGLPVCTILQNC